MPPQDDNTYGAKPPKRTIEGHNVCTVVHTNGVHHLPFIKCTCEDAAPFDIQLLRAGFYPSTGVQTRTVFTFELLDLYLIDVVVCHTATNSFYAKLRRLTNDSFPDSVPVQSPFFASHREYLQMRVFPIRTATASSFGLGVNGDT
jgi:hypothetical protein